MAEEEIKGANTVLELLENPTKFLSSILVGNNLVNILASALATSLGIEFFGNTGIGIATGLVTFLILIFGEITPKSLAVKHAEKLSLSIASIIKFLCKLLTPITFLLLKITNGLIHLLDSSAKEHKPFLTQEEFLTMVNLGHEEGVLEEDEKEMLENVFEFKDSLVRTVMTPRPDIVFVETNITYSELKEVFKHNPYSRIPVCGDDIDKIIGFVHIRDLATSDDDLDQFNLTEIMNKPYFTFELQSITKLLRTMRTKQIHIAVVLDEYGGTAGIVTIEDLIEEIIGEIEDEYDIQEAEIQKLNDKEYLIEGSTNIEDVNDYFDFDIDEDGFDSIGGFLYSAFDRVPEEGESIDYKNLTFTVQAMDKNRIEKAHLFITSIPKDKDIAEN